MCRGHKGFAPPRTRVGFICTIIIIGSFLWSTCVRGNIIEADISGRIFSENHAGGVLAANGQASPHGGIVTEAVDRFYDTHINHQIENNGPLAGGPTEEFGRKLEARKLEDRKTKRYVIVIHVISASICMALVSLFGVLLPDIIEKWGKNHSAQCRLIIQGLTTAFAAGAFWGLAILHMILEAVDDLARANRGLFLGKEKAFLNEAYPLVLVGYLSMVGLQYFTEVLAVRSKLRNKGTVVSAGTVDGVIASIALTIHAVFEGLVAGMRNDVLLVWVASLAIIGHKWAESFSLAQSLKIRSVPEKTRVIILAIFVIASPVGAVAGLFVNIVQDGAFLGIICALSAGILTFVAAHCTAEVFESTNHVHNKFLSKNDDLPVTRPDTDKAAAINPEILVPSIKLFIGKFLSMCGGSALVFGMIVVHMTWPADAHHVH